MKNPLKNARPNWLRTSVAALVFIATLFNVTINAEVDEVTNSLQSLSLGIREAVSDEDPVSPTNYYIFEFCGMPGGNVGGRCWDLGGNCLTQVYCG